MIYVMSDIHGNKRRFDSIMKQINLQPEDTLYVLGDVVDRHPHGGRILRQLMKMPNVQMILGNHEYMMLDALDRPFDEKDWHQEDEHRRYLYQWYRNGGEVTHAYLKHIKKELRREIFDYLRKLPINITIEVNGIKYKLVHGAPVEMYDKDLRRYDDGIEISDAEPLMEYILSCHGNQNQYLLSRYKEFRTFVERKVRKSYHITKDAGIFICRR